jgi:transposase
MSVFAPEVARPTLVFRGLLGRAEPILITGGRAVADYREAFLGIDVAKLKNAIAVAESGRDGESFSMESTLEVLTTRRPGREIHRQWRKEVKAQIVSESLRPGALVNEVAERHGLKPNHLSTWRTMARQGKLILPAPKDAVEFAAVIVDSPVLEPPIKKVSRPEIIVGSVIICLEEGASTTRIAAVARACAVPA